MERNTTQPNQAAKSNTGFRPGARERIKKVVDGDLRKFDLVKKQRAAKSVEDMKKIYITN